MTEFTFSDERYRTTGRDRRRRDIDRTGAIRIARDAYSPATVGRGEISLAAEVARLLRAGTTVRLGRHAIEVIEVSTFRLWIVPLGECDDERDALNFAAGGRCARTTSCWREPLHLVEPDYDRMAEAFVATCFADADDLPSEVTGARAA